MSSLFVAIPPASAESPLCLGIVLGDPAQAATSGTGFVDGDPEREVQWEVFREFDGADSAVQPEDMMTHDGFLLERVSVSSSIVLVGGSIILSEGHGDICTTDVTLSMHCSSIFDLAPYQAALWLSAFCDIRFKGFLGNFDRNVHFEALKRPWLEGDLIKYYLSGQPRAVGVAELVTREVDNTWIARLHGIGAVDELGRNDVLHSRTQTECEGVTATFECPFASIQSVL